VLFQKKANNEKLQVPFTYVQTEKEAIPVLKSLLEEYLLGVDTETTGRDPHTHKILLLQISTSRKNYVFNMINGELFNKNSESLSLLKESMESNGIVKLAHNGIFEFKMIFGKLNIRINLLFDTMLAELLLNPVKEIKPGVRGKLPSLDDVCFKYLGIRLDKSIRKQFYAGYKFDKFTPEQLQYAANDSAVMLPLYNIFLEKLEEWELMPTMELETRCLPVFAMMEFNGVLLDTIKWRTFLKELNYEYAEVSTKIKNHLKSVIKRKDIFGRPIINLSSNAQLLNSLNDLGISCEDTKESTLELFKNSHPIVPLLLELRQKEKILSTYGENLLDYINNTTGRIHSDFIQLGTGSGRSSSSSPNAQNIPRGKYRSCFIAPDGYVWLSADYGGQEYRLLAYLSNEEGVLEGFRKGLDFHSNTAMMVYNHIPEEFMSILNSLKDKKKKGQEDLITDKEKEYENQRYRCKTMNFLANYGGGAGRLSAVLKIPVEEAKKLLQQYNEGLPNMKRFRDVEGEKTVKRLYSETMLGRKRFYELSSDLTEEERRKVEAKIGRMGTNHIIQGTSASMTKLALCLIYEEFEKRNLDAQIISMVHDEINCYAKEEIKEEVIEIIRDKMKEAFYYFIPKDKCPAEVEINCSLHWSH